MQDLTREMYGMIELNVPDGLDRSEMYDLLDKIEEKYNNLKSKT